MTAEKEIRERLLEQAIPSDYMKEFYRSINRNFTDFELAAMLWNSSMKRMEILQAIKELSEITKDSVLREQIENRLRYEREAYRFLVDNEDGKYIYTVEYEDKEWPGGFSGSWMRQSLLQRKTASGGFPSVSKSSWRMSR